MYFYFLSIDKQLLRETLSISEGNGEIQKKVEGNFDEKRL